MYIYIYSYMCTYILILQSGGQENVAHIVNRQVFVLYVLIIDTIKNLAIYMHYSLSFPIVYKMNKLILQYQFRAAENLPAITIIIV